MMGPSEESLPKRAALSPSGRLSYFFLSIVFCVFSMVCFYVGLVGTRGEPPDRRILWVGVALGLIACVTAWMKVQTLRFTILRTQDDAPENYRRVLQIVVEQDWRIRDDVKSELISAQVKAPLVDLTWGELVTVRMSQNYVAVNCIGDPYLNATGSRGSRSRIKADVNLIVSALRIL